MTQNRLIDALDRMQASPSANAAWSSAACLLKDCGSDWISAGTAARSTQGALAVRSTTPAALMADYVGERLHLSDPWMAHCARTNDPDRFDPADVLNAPLPTRTTHLGRLFHDHGVKCAILLPCFGGARTGGIVLYARSQMAADHLARPEGFDHARLVTAIVAAHYRPDTDLSLSPERYALDNPLSRREREVLMWLSTGLQTGRIAERMAIEAVTVSKHLGTIRRKLGARTREAALAIAIRDGLITL